MILCPSDMPSLDLSDGIDLINFLYHRADREECFSAAFDMLIENMKQGMLHDVNIVLISNGYGIINSSKFTLEWEAYRKTNRIRVMTAVTGGDSACGLTELSDEIFIFNDDTIRNRKMEFAKLAEILIL